MPTTFYCLLTYFRVLDSYVTGIRVSDSYVTISYLLLSQWGEIGATRKEGTKEGRQEHTNKTTHAQVRAREEDTHTHTHTPTTRHNTHAHRGQPQGAWAPQGPWPQADTDDHTQVVDQTFVANLHPSQLTVPYTFLNKLAVVVRRRPSWSVVIRRRPSSSVVVRRPSPVVVVCRPRSSSSGFMLWKIL